MKYILLFICFSGNLFGQNMNNSQILDASNGSPIEGATIVDIDMDISAVSDENGQFLLSNSSENMVVEFHDNTISWTSSKKFSANLFNIIGQSIISWKSETPNNGELHLSQDLPVGLYFIYVHSEKGDRTFRFFSSIGMHSKSKEITFGDSILISKEGYYSQKFEVKNDHDSYYLIPNRELTHLLFLPHENAFEKLQSTPFNPTFGQVNSVKLLYDIESKQIYFFNSKKYLAHYHFAEDVLDYKKGKSAFSHLEYTYNSERKYFPAILNYYTNSDKYVLEFSAFCEINCVDIQVIYDAILKSSFIQKSKFYYYANKPETICENVPNITTQDLYSDQLYQGVNPGESYGFLKKIDIDSISTIYYNYQDILMINGLPAELNIFAGLITTEFQSALSHVSVLSHNRNTPNMALRNAFEDEKILNLVGKLVYLKVTLDSFVLREASLTEAQIYWDTKSPKDVQVPSKDIDTKGLLDLNQYGAENVATLGGKAANFAELLKIRVDSMPIPTPEHSFGIPIYYYDQHIKNNGIDILIENLLNDSLIYKNPAYKKEKLISLQQAIVNSPLDPVLLKLVKDKIQLSNPNANYKFRSSTNAEDIAGFNGAGLYDSFTGHLTKPSKPIDLAIKNTWASIWNLRAFDERQYFNIDQESVAMAILVHKSFPDELANGVVLTYNPFSIYNDAIFINVQVGENSIVRPEINYFPDQILYYTFKLVDEAYEYTAHTTVPGWESKTIMTPSELKLLQKYCLAIEDHFCQYNPHPPCPTMDIEFKIDDVDGKRIIYIKQARYY